jgi:hypothetical protein
MQLPLKEYQGKKVRFTLALREPVDGQSTAKVEGHVDLVAPDESALIIKEKGHSMTRLIEASMIQLDTIEFIYETPRALKARRLDPLSVAHARQHLLDRHEFHLAAINGMTDDQAWVAHKDIDHGPLGHYHAERDEAEAGTETND